MRTVKVNYPQIHGGLTHAKQLEVTQVVAQVPAISVCFSCKEEDVACELMITPHEVMYNLLYFKYQRCLQSRNTIQSLFSTAPPSHTQDPLALVP